MNHELRETGNHPGGRMCKCPFTKSETFTKCYNKKEASAEDDKRRWTNDQGTSAIVGHRWEIGDLSLSLRMTTCSLESFFHILLLILSQSCRRR